MHIATYERMRWIITKWMTRSGEIARTQGGSPITQKKKQPQALYLKKKSQRWNEIK